MFVIQNIIITIASILQVVINLYTFVVIISALVSWVNPDPYNPIVRTLRMLTEPVFYYIRKKLPFVFIGGIDLSPIIVLFGLQLINGIIVTSMFQFAAKL